tara:strand:- start:583 stop:1257 length:675 start_codon:yes stop_codon:yes gene_type:complete
MLNKKDESVKTRNLYLVRHGQSIYNLENRFTGWKDVDLTTLGKAQAKEAGKILSEVDFDYCYISNLKRAKNTLQFILKEINQSPQIENNIALNERDYGDLIGQNKDEAAQKFGADQVQIWRRSFDIPPPGGESLKMTAERTLPYYRKIILPKVLESNNIIVSAHGNSIRAIVMDIFNLTSKQILKTEIGWCEPWKISYDRVGNLSNYKIIPRPSEPSNSQLYNK